MNICCVTALMAFTLWVSAAAADDNVVATVLNTNVLRHAVYTASDTERYELPEHLRDQLQEADRDKWQYCAFAIPLMCIVESALVVHFHAEHAFDVSESDIAQFRHYTEVAPVELHFGRPMSEVLSDLKKDDEWQSASFEDEADSLAEVILSEWIIQNKLYDRFGGRIAYDPVSGPYAAEAYELYLREAERDGLFHIYDEDLRRAFWTCFDIRRQTIEFMDDDIGEAALREYPGKGALRRMSHNFDRIFERIFNMDVETAISVIPSPPDWPDSRWSAEHSPNKAISDE